VDSQHRSDANRIPIASTGEAQTRRLARRRYENFTVASFLIPRELRQDLINIYAFCRLADDFADEPAEGVARSVLLDDWENRLRTAGNDNHTAGAPVNSAAVNDEYTALFEALGATMRHRGLELQPFLDLLTAFRLDLTKTRYQTWGELLDYAQYSANPVGRLVLAAAGISEPTLFAHSDKICTALQFANHWQDIARDFDYGRIYVPQESLNRYHIREAEIEARVMSHRFRDMMIELIERTRELFNEGKSLISAVPAFLRPQISLYWGGGMAALSAIKSRGYDTLNYRCRVRRRDRLWLGAEALGRWMAVKLAKK